MTESSHKQHFTIDFWVTNSTTLLLSTYKERIFSGLTSYSWSNNAVYIIIIYTWKFLSPLCIKYCNPGKLRRVRTFAMYCTHIVTCISMRSLSCVGKKWVFPIHHLTFQLKDALICNHTVTRKNWCLWHFTRLYNANTITSLQISTWNYFNLDIYVFITSTTKSKFRTCYTFVLLTDKTASGFI